MPLKIYLYKILSKFYIKCFNSCITKQSFTNKYYITLRIYNTVTDTVNFDEIAELCVL